MKKTNPFYKSRQWKSLRKRFLEHHFYVCKYCEGEANTVHHVVEISEDMSKALEWDNLECVCPPCHNSIHDRMKGTLRTPLEQTNEDGLSGDWI